MNKHIFYIILSFWFLKLDAQIPYEYTVNDSVCIENDFSYFIKLSTNRYLVSEDHITDNKGKVKVDLSSYSNLIFHPFNNNLTPVKKKESGKFGYIDPDGNVKIPFLYELASGFCEGVAVVKKSGKWGVIDTLNQIVIPIIYDDSNTPDENRFPIKKNRLFGLMDLDQKIIVDFKYLGLSFLKNGTLKIQTNTGFKTLDLSNYSESDDVYEELYSFSHSLSRFKFNGKWGLINSDGKIILENIYSRINSLENGLAVIRSTDDYYGMINKDGVFVIPIQYEGMKNDGVFVSANKDGIYYFFDYKGNRINKNNSGQSKRIGPCDLFLNTSVDSLFSLQYLNAEEIFNNVLFQKIGGISDGMMRARLNDSWHYYPLNKSKPLGPYKRASLFSNNKAIVQSNETDKVYIIDKTGKALTHHYDEIKRHAEAYLFRDNDKWGLASDLSGTKIKTVYDEIKLIAHHDPIFKVKSNKKYGVIRGDEIILPLEYDRIKGDFFYAGILEVVKNEEIAVVDKKGNILNEPKINYVEDNPYGLTLLGTATGFGIVNDKLQFVADPIYESLGSYRDGKRCSAKINGLWGFLNIEGEFIIEPKFKSVISFGTAHDVTAVKDSSGWRLIHKSGHFVTENVYSDINAIVTRTDQYFRIEVNGKWGVIDSEGKTLIPTSFTKIYRKNKFWELHLNDDFIRVDDNLKCIHNCTENEIIKTLTSMK